MAHGDLFRKMREIFFDNNCTKNCHTAYLRTKNGSKYEALEILERMLISTMPPPTRMHEPNATNKKKNAVNLKIDSEVWKKLSNSL